MRVPTALSAIRLVVSDIDGTLVRADKSLSAATVGAVDALRAAGIGFTLISARPPSGLGELVARLRLDTPLGAFNGATIFRPDGTIVSADRLAEATARGIVETYDRLAIPVWVFADGRWITRERAMAHIEQEIVATCQQPIVAADFERWIARADKVQGVCDDPARLAQAEAELTARFGTEATIARSQAYYLDATAPHTDKGHGVRELAAAFDVPLSAVAVAGDMPNDLPMFAVAGLSVAMGQGPEAVREKADRVTLSNDEDGLAAFLSQLVDASAGR